MVLKTFLHGQMTEQIASEVRPKNRGKLDFWVTKKWSYMKVKSKISYLFFRMYFNVKFQTFVDYTFFPITIITVI